MWIKLRKPKTETQLLKESVQQLECKVAVMEAVGDLQNELFESGLVNEGTNKILEKLKAGVMKLCPSPEKLKDFFKKMGEKVDAKMQNCKVEAVKNAWNTLKGIVGAQDSLDQQIANGEGEEAPQGDEAQPTDDGSGEAQGDETGNEQGNPEGSEQEDIAAESLYDDWEDYEEYDDADYEDTDDGYEDWSEYGDDEYEDEYEEDEYGKWYDYSYFEATGKVPVKKPVKKAAPKKAPAKKPVAKKPVAKKPATKKPVAKKQVKKAPAKKGATKKAPTRKVAKKGAAQAQGQEETPQTKKQKILQWLKAHWKQVALVLLIAVGMYFGIGWLMGALTKSAAVGAAASTVSKFRMPFGMKELPPGAKLIGNGVVKFANGGMLACPDGDIDTDF